LTWLRKIGQTLLVAVALLVFLTPSHYEIEFVKYVCGRSLLGCIALWVVIIGLIAIALWAWITDILEKRKKKTKNKLSGETLIS
jgi:hypothetical protein